MKIYVSGVLSVLPWPEDEEKVLPFLQGEAGGLFLQRIRYLCLPGTKEMQLLENVDGKLDNLPLNEIASRLMTPEQRRPVYGHVLMVKKDGKNDAGMTLEEACGIMEKINKAVLETA